MLVVKLEVHPNGDSSRAEEIGRLEIANISGLADVSDYSFEFVGKGEEYIFGEVTGHKRDQPAGAWKLVRKVLVWTFGEEEE